MVLELPGGRQGRSPFCPTLSGNLGTHGAKRRKALIKNLVALWALPFMLLAPGWVQGEEAASGQAADRTLFPKNFLRGFADFAVAPPHNEPDLGRCALSIAPCSTFPRFLLSGYLEFQPFGRGPLRRAFFFFEPIMYFGDNIPQVRYTASASPMALERVMGLGVELPRNLELRFLNHQVDWFGRYGRHFGAADLGSDKPMGQYATIGMRWYFGGWGRRH